VDSSEHWLTHLALLERPSPLGTPTLPQLFLEVTHGQLDIAGKVALWAMVSVMASLKKSKLRATCVTTHLELNA
jgi:hypothetical protein